MSSHFQTTYTRWHPHIPHLGQAAHDAARRDDISWISLIRTARVSYAFQAIVAAALLLPPQMRDMLAALTETHNLRAWIAFPASMAVFGFLSWYWARATLSARFDLPDTKLCWDDAVEAGRQGHRPYVRSQPLHIVPQAPIPIAGVTGMALALQSGAYLLGLTTLGLLLLVWFGVSRRQQLHAWLRHTLMPGRVFPAEPLAPEDPDLRSTYSVRLWLQRVPHRFAKIMQRAPSGVWPAAALLTLSMGVFTVTALASFFPAVAQRDWRNLIWTVWHGPTPVMLGCALMIGPFTVLSFVLDGLRLSIWIRDAPIGLSRPPLMTALLLASAMGPEATTLHALRVVPGPLPARPALAAEWTAWQAQCGAGTRPVVVAISGGASRAALWGAAVLARVDQAAAGQHAAIFAVSTVSGGSLGAAAYLSARAAIPTGPAGNAASCRLPDTLQAPFERYAKALSAADAIGPLLSGVILSDVPRRLFGFVPGLLGAPMRGGDRAAALERAFEANASRAARRAKLPAVPLDAPYLLLSGPGMPLWVGLGTERDSGRRVLVTPVRSGDGSGWPFQGASDLLAQLGADIPISTAINATARFPFLEPSGVALSGQFMHRGMALIDGGYYDQSGLETALELADWLRAHGAQPVVIAANASGDAPGLEAHGTQAPDNDIVRCGAGEFRPDQPPVAISAADVLAPFIGLYSARGGHVDALLRRARAEWCGTPQSFFHFYLGALGRDPVPLNWVLSDEMANHVWLSAGLGDAGNEANDPVVESNRREGARLDAALGSVKQGQGALPPGPPLGP